MYLFHFRSNLIGQPTIVGDLFSEAECDDIVRIGELGLEVAAGRLEQHQVAKAIRRSGIGAFGPQGEVRCVFNRLRACLNDVNADWFRYDLIGFEGLQFTKHSARKDEPDYYSSHMDLQATDMGTIRKLSFTIQLSQPESYEGGDVLLYETIQKSLPFSRKKGSVTFLPLHALHEVLPATSGVRYSLVGGAHGAPFSSGVATSKDSVRRGPARFRRPRTTHAPSPACYRPCAR